MSARHQDVDGLSPPTRGNHQPMTGERERKGSIPAHAGEPRTCRGAGTAGRVYPRPRGGTPRRRILGSRPRGLSPPTRGNHWRNPNQRPAGGSIPAHAGEPRGLVAGKPALLVYPRPRGGTSQRSGDGIAAFGLSPPTRGNLRSRTHRRRIRRSIPAHAGEPVLSPPRAWRHRVYPRPRGGTARWRLLHLIVRGLSPPTRGNPNYCLAQLDRRGSIPAHAGEPARILAYRRSRSVYPRPRGGTVAMSKPLALDLGLSPPTRGNRDEMRVRRTIQGSIPAHAGEPSDHWTKRVSRAVYPRPRGGTLCERCRRGKTDGLSPPTRGNPKRFRCLRCGDGSIPAHAGEPNRNSRRRRRGGVYPRPRGGTGVVIGLALSARGLSPPTRGNRVYRPHRDSNVGSIPAHAGEPGLPPTS